MQSLLDFSRPMDIPFLEKVVLTMNTSTNNEERREAERFLVEFREHPDSWTRVDAILEQAQSVDTKYYALQILEQLITTRWKILPREQCEGIKNFIVALIIKLSSDDRTMTEQRFFLTKLDLTLVQILKQDWPQNWPTFIPDLVGSSKTNETLCENNMAILLYLSEEIFDFSAEQMVSQKVKDLKNQMCGEFSQIFHLCMLVFETAQKPSLLKATLQTLLRFLNWIPLGYIFETNLMRILIEKFFGVPVFRNVVMKCLTEIGSLSVGNVYDEQFRYLFLGTIQKLMTFLPLDFNLRDVYDRGSEEDTKFIQDLALFLSGYMREHIKLVESPDNQLMLLHAHQYLLTVTEVEEREVFKVCLEYWSKLVSEMYNDGPPQYVMGSPLMLNNNTSAQGRRQLYAPVLSKLRLVMINHMAKPEEVLIVENDEGEIVREAQKDTDSIALYKSMRECLIYLTHLDYADMESIMLDKLSKQIDGSEWSWNNLNKLCWAIGSISGAMSEEDEKRFLVTVIKELLGLTEMKRGKDNKAVVASNIMYIVGQYPRFLKAHWKFLKTVVNKLFEFMHELHEGVQDMACDTFIKIAQKCRKHFVVYQVGELVPFIEEILTMMPNIIFDLQPHQVHTFYEAVGYMIQAQTDKQVQERLIFKFMELPNSAWDLTIQQAGQNVQLLRDSEKLKSLANVLKTNVSACTAIGHPYVVQLGRIFLDMLNLYKAVSEIIAGEVLQFGDVALKYSFTRYLRTIKKETLKLLETFISKNEDPHMVSETFIPPMFKVILLDYAQNPPAAREADVLNLMASCIEKLDVFMVDKVPAMLDSVFECTVQMICRDFSEFPEHRVGFFRFIKAINACCFAALCKLPPPQFKLVMDSIVWAFKHTMRDIAETGLQIVHELLGHVREWQSQNPAGAALFYQTYFLSLMQDIFVVLTDREHKSGFKMQVMILAHMFHLVESNQIQAPLWTDNQPPNITNGIFLRDYVMNLLRNAFPHLTNGQIQHFVVGLFSKNTDLPEFKSALRDFLIQLKEFSGQDNQELYVEETEAALAVQRRAELEAAMRVPGMIRPQDRPEFNLMD